MIIYYTKLSFMSTSSESVTIPAKVAGFLQYVSDDSPLEYIYREEL